MSVANKELGQIIKSAQKQGWLVSLTSNNHYKWVSPLGGFFFSASTPSDHRAFKNIKRDLKRYGYIEIERQAPRRPRI